MLNGDAVTKIAELATGGDHVVEVEGTNFHINPAKATVLEFPRKSADAVFSLSQLISWILASRRDDPKQNLIVNISGPDKVEVWDTAYNKNKEREILAEADFGEVYQKFPFGQQLSQEEFIIKLQTMFIKDDARDLLMKTVSAVRAEKITTSDDDGYSQTAGMKAGVLLTNKESVQNLWDLRTYLTFPEVDQPTVPYILRLHQRQDELPKFALYTCDGDLWKVKTTLAVREYLESRLEAVLPNDFGSNVVVL